MTDLLTNIGRKIYLELTSDVKCEEWDYIKTLSPMCSDVKVTRLILSTGQCEIVTPSEDMIETFNVYLKSAEDMNIFKDLVTQYPVWIVRLSLSLTDLGPDDWTLLSELVK